MEEFLANYSSAKENDRAYIEHETDPQTGDHTFYLCKKVFDPETGQELQIIRSGISKQEIENVIDYLTLKLESANQLKEDLNNYQDSI